MYLNPNTKCSGATQLPGNIFTAHRTHDFTTDLVFEHRPPRDQAETEPVVDHGKSAAGQLRRAQKLSTHGLALLNRREGKVIGAPEGIRTPDPQIRSLVLYPAELPAPKQGQGYLNS
jgi:hypothetical protein